MDHQAVQALEEDPEEERQTDAQEYLQYQVDRILAPGQQSDRRQGQADDEFQNDRDAFGVHECPGKLAQDLETGTDLAGVRGGVYGVDPAHGRPFAQCLGESLEGLGVPGGHALDATVRQIAYPARQSEATGRALYELTKPDALDPAADRKMFRRHAETMTRDVSLSAKYLLDNDFGGVQNSGACPGRSP